MVLILYKEYVSEVSTVLLPIFNDCDPPIVLISFASLKEKLYLVQRVFEFWIYKLKA